MELKFPDGFLWGAATSAHQVEGGNKNDWTEWEQKNAERLANMARMRYENGINSPLPNHLIEKERGQFEPWPDYILRNYPNPLQEENYISGRACEHYIRFREDFNIAKSLGHNAHRFSIEWSRIEPEDGKFDEKEIEHYRQVILALRERGIEPFVTLWHWTLPLWVCDIGGWENKKTIKYFTRYAEKIVEELGSEVKFWITLNETNVYTGFSYFKGFWPPEKRSLIKYLRANHYLSQAHAAACKAIKKINPAAQIGVAHNVMHFTGLFAGLKRFVYNYLFLNSLGRFQDFIGINYYKSDRNAGERTDMDWPIDAEGFYHVLKDADRYKKPIYVLENGIADAKDDGREIFIKEHVRSMKKAIDEGVDVRGYFYWSLLDNFEWDKGFWPKFGLVEIDYKTMERKVRPSAWEYAKICKNNFLEIIE